MFIDWSQSDTSCLRVCLWEQARFRSADQNISSQTEGLIFDGRTNVYIVSCFYLFVCPANLWWNYWTILPACYGGTLSYEMRANGMYIFIIGNIGVTFDESRSRPYSNGKASTEMESLSFSPVLEQHFCITRVIQKCNVTRLKVSWIIAAQLEINNILNFGNEVNFKLEEFMKH